MNNGSIYLCGPITGLSTDVARHGWREEVYEALTPCGITCFSPMRSDDHLAGLEDLQAEGYHSNVLTTPRGINARDRFDTTRCDIVFCNLLGAKRVSIGSMIEFGWADMARKPMVVVMEEGNVHQHAMVQDLADYIVPTVEEAIAVVKKLLIPGV